MREVDKEENFRAEIKEVQGAIQDHDETIREVVGLLVGMVVEMPGKEAIDHEEIMMTNSRDKTASGQAERAMEVVTREKEDTDLGVSLVIIVLMALLQSEIRMILKTKDPEGPEKMRHE